MNRSVLLLLCLVPLLPAAAQWLDHKTPGIPRNADGSVDAAAPAPRTADGRPDFNGIWVPVSVEGDFLDPDSVQPWAQQRMQTSADNFFSDEPRFHCLPDGPAVYTAGGAYGGMRRIVQSPGLIAVLYGDLTYRQIHLDGRELEDDPFPAWMGYSAGRWDGDTLVVESNGYNERTWLHREGLPHTEQLRITERYRRESFGRIVLDIEYVDPGTFNAPVSATVVMRYAADSELLETVCNESTKGTSHYNGEISEAEQKVVEVSADTLAKYVGVYTGAWLGNPIRAEVLLEDGVLYLERTPPYSDTDKRETARSPLVAQSQNAFDCDCGLGFVFSDERDGRTQRLLEVHVSGAWAFEREQ